MTVEKSEITHFVYEKSDDYRSIYFTTARGGMVGDYDFKLYLYCDHLIDVTEEIVEEDGSRKLTPTIDEYSSTIRREVMGELMMPYKTMVELRNYLSKIIGDNQKKSDEEKVKFAEKTEL